VIRFTRFGIATTPVEAIQCRARVSILIRFCPG
jgi:hypothetical protein